MSFVITNNNFFCNGKYKLFMNDADMLLFVMSGNMIRTLANVTYSEQYFVATFKNGSFRRKPDLFQAFLIYLIHSCKQDM